MNKKVVIYYTNRETKQKEYAVNLCKNKQPVAFTTDINNAYDFKTLKNANNHLFVFNSVHKRSHLISTVDNPSKV